MRKKASLIKMLQFRIVVLLQKGYSKRQISPAEKCSKKAVYIIHRSRLKTVRDI